MLRKHIWRAVRCGHAWLDHCRHWSWLEIQTSPGVPCSSVLRTVWHKKGWVPHVGQGTPPPSALSVDKLTGQTRALDRNVLERLQAKVRSWLGLTCVAFAGTPDASHAQLVLSWLLSTRGVKRTGQSLRRQKWSSVSTFPQLVHVRRPLLNIWAPLHSSYHPFTNSSWSLGQGPKQDEDKPFSSLTTVLTTWNNTVHVASSPNTHYRHLMCTLHRQDTRLAPCFQLSILKVSL